MLKPVAMQKIRIAGVRDRMDDAVALLYDLGAVEFAKVREGGLAQDVPTEAYTRMAEELVRLSGIQAALPKRPVAQMDLLSPEELLAETSKITIDKRLGQIEDRLADISSEKAELRQVLTLLEGLEGMDVHLALMKSTAACISVGLIPVGKLAALNAALGAKTDRFILRSKQVNKFEMVIVLVADGKFRDFVAAALARAGFTEVRLPEVCATAANPLATISGKMSKLEVEADELGLNKDLDALADAHYSTVANLREMLQVQCDRAHAPSQFVRTAHAFVLDAWLPADRLAEVSSLLKKKFGGDVAVQRVDDGEMPPTLLNNPRPLGPFQFMVEFISLPSAHDLDPTLIFALFFPIIYGMMLGDVGYGLISLLIGYAAMKKFKGTILEEVGKVWMYAAIPAIFFGVFYNEYFGFNLLHLLEVLGASPESLPAFVSYAGLPRMANLTTLIVITIFTGAIHLAFGFLFGAYKEWHEGKVAHAAAKLAWILVEISGFVLVAGFMFNAVPSAWAYPAGGVMLAALAVIVYSEGPMGLIEVPGLAGNILSYARIAAAGVASVIIAELINELLLPKPEMGILFFILLPVYIGLHLFNIVLGMFESLIQGARLNYVEFFSKFYEGGGRRFNPFMHAKKTVT